MSKINLLIVFILVVLQFSSAAQKISTNQIYSKRLQIGDNVSHLYLSNLVNYAQKNVKLSDFKGKWVVLDFWGTHCAGCIASWPHLMDLQSQFKGKLQIITVDPEENETTIQQAFERTKRLTNVNMTLPTQCGDIYLNKLFPHTSVPFAVLIDENGYIRYFTFGTSLNLENITALLSGENGDFLPAIDNAELIHPNWGEPIFLNGNGGKPKKIFWQSTFSKSDPRVFPDLVIASNKPAVGGMFAGKHFAIANGSIIDMYELAYSNRMSVQEPELDFHKPYLELLLPSRILLDVADSNKYVDHIHGVYRYDHHYLYQLLSPDTTATIGKMQKLMQEDLKRFIGLDARWEKRKVKCLILSAEDTILISYKTGPAEGGVDNTHFSMNKVSMAYLIYTMESTLSGYNYIPIIDETNFKGKVGSIKFETDNNNPVALNEALRKYKMSFTLGEREIEVLVISEPVNYVFPY
jgi:thiol-disulfide isomerase/thioredoxin